MGRDFSTSRAVLIGNGTFTDERSLGEVPAAGCIAAMTQLLTSDLCGWPPDRIEQVLDVAAPSVLAVKVLQYVRDVQGVLLVYYVGHGLRTSDGQLALAVRDTIYTDRDALPYTAMLYRNLAEIIGKGSPAATKLVILDCCMAELANKSGDGFQTAGVAEPEPVDGLYCIFAAQENQSAKFPLHGDLTYFTEAFIDTVRSGISGKPTDLRLDEIFAEVRRQLSADGLPQPADSGIRDARQYPFARNAAHPSTPVPAAADVARQERLRILTLAEQTAQSINRAFRNATLAARAVALLKVAAAVVPDDPDWSRQLVRRAARIAASSKLDNYDLANLAMAMAPVALSRAERIARTITDGSKQTRALAHIAWITAPADPARAIRIASEITDPDKKAEALANAAKNAARVEGNDPGQAESIAAAICDPTRRARALAEVAAAVADRDPGRAGQIADQILSLGHPQSLGTIVHAIAASDPERAETLARQIPRQESRDSALGDIVRAIAETDVDRAERITTTITDQFELKYAQTFLVLGLASRDPDRAEQVAAAITDKELKCHALSIIGRELLESAPDRARHLLYVTEHIARGIGNSSSRDSALTEAAKLAVQIDPAHAARILSTLSDPNSEVTSLVEIAETAASKDIQQAEKIAHYATDDYWKAYLLVSIARRAARVSPGNVSRLLDQAEQKAGAITDPENRAKILASIAVATADDDPVRAMRLIDHAESIARTIPPSRPLSTPIKDRTLKEIVTAILYSHAGRQVLIDYAGRIARDIPAFDIQAEALRRIAEETFPDDPRRAERAALAIKSESHRVEALIDLAALHASVAPAPESEEPNSTV